MTSFDRYASELLERAAPTFAGGHGDWNEVLTRAGVHDGNSVAPVSETTPRASGSQVPRRRPATPRNRPHASRPLRVALVALLGAAGAAAVLSLAHRDGMSLSGRALAALGGQPVLHAVVRHSSSPRDSVVQLSTGRTRRHTSATEYWYDAQRRQLEIHELRDGKVMAETFNTTSGGVSSSGGRSKPGGYTLAPDPALRDFLTGYQTALETQRAQVTGHGVLAGKHVTWVSIPTRYPHISDLVALDTATYRPLRFRSVNENHPGYSGPWEMITAIGTLPRRAAPFRTPTIMAHPSIGSVTGSRAISPTMARSALGHTALWPGKTIGGLPLAAANLQHLRTGYPRAAHKDPVFGRGLELLYGSLTGNDKLDWTRPNVQIRESARPQMAYMFGSSPAGPLTFSSYPLARPGWIDVISLTSSGAVPDGRSTWIGQLRKHGLYLTIQASSRAVLLDTARRLHSTP